MVRPNSSTLLPLRQYDYIIVAFSGGKDSTACSLHLAHLGVPFEHWHQDVDGGTPFMDWPITTAYVKAYGRAFGITTRLQCREGGFLREMLRDGHPTAPVKFQLNGIGKIGTAGGRGRPGTRRKFPQVSASLKTRWCSAALKIDPCATAINNDPRFKNAKVLLVTGERRQESSNRANYASVERHKSTTLSRRVDQWRPILEWTEEEVWSIIERNRVRPHPAYSLGWGRLSCMSCIFGTPDQWAAIQDLDEDAFERIAGYEEAFGYTIHRKESVRQLAARGRSYVPRNTKLRGLALSRDYRPEWIVLRDDETWKLPKGAYKMAGGPS